MESYLGAIFEISENEEGTNIWECLSLPNHQMICVHYLILMTNTIIISHLATGKLRLRLVNKLLLLKEVRWARISTSWKTMLLDYQEKREMVSLLLFLLLVRRQLPWRTLKYLNTLFKGIVNYKKLIYCGCMALAANPLILTHKTDPSETSSGF